MARITRGCAAMKIVKVDPKLCTACMLCADTLPEVFEMSGDDVAVVKDPRGAGEAEIQERIDDCPSEAIHW